ncbi:LysR family transcriptional regulator [Pseudomonas typographi]|uniref:LysR family transcriptional regulator n=1 Tax=Pseudomonas typographi TaxID=2715964 RepID=UPI0016879EBA|nr:LysR family transcriptional regulator [Pseudomonas typographi]MBD1585564.1 LysR family transcriptional regulator [Pseudomonas typographi]
MNTPDPFRGIAVFMQVVQAGSFTLAAERLDMSKSGVAKSIARLEATLGVRLFQRTTRRLSLTEQGRQFGDGCLRALAELEGAQALVTTQRQELAGRLRVDLPVVFGRRWVLPALLEIAAKHPALELDVSLTDRRVDLVEDGIDLVIRIGPLQDSATLVAKSLGVQQAVLVAHPDYLARHGQPQTPDDLHRHACITFGSGGQARPWHFLDRHGRSQPLAVRGRLGLNHSEAILDAALAGHGIALLSDWLLAEHLAAARLTRVLPEARTQGFPIHAVWQKNLHVLAKVRRVVDELAERFVPRPPWQVVSIDGAGAMP